MLGALKNALADIWAYRFVNLITIVTIALSMLMISLFLLFFENASRLIQDWHHGGRAVVYLEMGFPREALPDLEKQILALGEVDILGFVSREEALESLKQEWAGQTAFFDGLSTNPLPHCLEIRVMDIQGAAIGEMANRIQSLDGVESVEYGRDWLGQFVHLFSLFRSGGYLVSGLFLLIALFVIFNTLRLVFYARKQEIEIMRLVGASEAFIKTPFYLEGVVQGFLGGGLGIVVLLLVYSLALPSASHYLMSDFHLDIRFLSFGTLALVLFCSIFLGWFGCYLSLRQILK